MPAWLGKLLLTVASAVVTLVAVDLVLLAVLGPVHVLEDFYTPDPRFGYRMRPHAVFEFANPYHGYHATVRTNALGLRGPEVRVPKTPGVYRILLAGDSMTAGLEVNQEETFAAGCERLLGATRRTEVINAGVRGYNLDNVLGFLRAEGLALEPDLVVYVFTDNDLITKPAYSPASADVSRGFSLGGVRGRLMAYSHLTYRLELLRQQLLLRRQRDRREERAARQTLPGGLVTFFTHAPDDPAEPFQLTADRIAALAEMCRARGIDFMLAAAPQREEIDPHAQAWLERQLAGQLGPLDFDGERRYLDHVAARIGVPRIDPIPAFRAHFPDDHDYWFHRDGHLNRRGHERMAAVLAEAIEKLAHFQAR
jgi:lysophospholipase L1-like esterase